MTTYLHTGASIANYKAVQIVPGPNAGETALVVIALGPYQLSFVGWDAEAIAAEWNISSNPFFQQITASVNETALILTSNILGQDFEVTVSINGDGGSRVSAIQVLTLRASGGTLTLSDGTVTSGAITYSATPATLRANIQAAINAMSGYSSGDVVVSGNGPFLLEFDSGRFAGLAVTLWTAVSSLTGGTALATVTTSQNGNAGANEIITISFPADGTHNEDLDEIQEIDVGSATSGEFVLTLPSYGATGSIPFTAGRSRIKTELENLVGLNNTIVTGGPLAREIPPEFSIVEATSVVTHTGYFRNTDGLVSASGIGDTWLAFNNNWDASSTLQAGLVRLTLNIPQGSLIERADFTRYGQLGTGSDDTSYLVYAVASDDAAWPADRAAALTNTLLPTINEIRSPRTESGESTTSSLLETIQTVVNQAGWVSGNAILLYFVGQSSVQPGEASMYTSVGSTNPPEFEILYNTATNLVNGVLSNDGYASSVGNRTTVSVFDDTSIGVLAGAIDPDYFNGLICFTLAVAQGTTVDDAILTLSGISNGSGDIASGSIYGIDADNPTWPTNTSTAAALLTSGITDAAIGYQVIANSGPFEQAFDVTEVIQELVNRAGWVSGNRIILYFYSINSPYNFSFAASEHATEEPPKLSCLVAVPGTYTYNPITVQFTGDVGGLNLSQMTADTIATITTTQDGGPQTVENISGGTWSLIVTNPATSTTYNIPNIPYDVSAAELDTRIEAVCGAGTVTVTGGPAPSTPLVIQFTGALEKAALTETLVSSLTGNFGTSSSLTTIREAISPPEVDNCWDMTVIPGEGTLAVSDEGPLVSRGYLVITITEPESINPASIIDNNIYVPLYNINPARIESAINEAYGKDVVRCTRIVHSLEHAEIPAHTDYSSISTVATPLHFWYYRDVFRLVFVNAFQASASITDVAVTIAPISDVNPAAASPALWMVAATPPATNDTLDLYNESQRVYLGFTDYLTNEDADQYHEFSCVRNSNTISNKLSYRVKLLTQFAASGENSSDLKRAGVARQITDNTVIFSWVKQTPASPSQYPAGYSVICSTPALNWDSSADDIEAALSALTTGFMNSVTVTGTLYNSWLSESDIDEPLPENSYNDLRITLDGTLANLPLTELGYTLIATITPAPASPDLRNPLIWIEPYSVPLPGGLNQRQRFSLADSASVTALSLVIDEYTISGLTPATTAAQLQALIAATVGSVPSGGTAVEGWGVPIPEKWRNPVTVYGTTLAQPVEIEFSGFGFQYTEHSSALGVTGATSVITFVETQAGVNPVGEVQNLVISGDPHGGTYTIDGGASLAYNANAAAIQADLGAAPPTVTGTYPAFVLTWPSASGNVAQLATTSALNNSFVTVTGDDDDAQEGGLGASATVSDLTPGTGPLYLDNPQNYSPAAVFGSEDTLVIDDTVTAIRFGIDMSSYFTVIDLGVGVGTIFQYTRNRIVFQDDQKVYLTGTGTAPAGLTFGNAYYIVNSTNSYTFGLAATPSGAAIVVTTVGAGTFRLTLRNVTLTVYSRYTGNNIGLPNNNSSTSLPEYLPKYLVLPGVIADIGVGDGNGLSLLRLNSDDQPATILIQQSGQSGTSNIPAVLLLCDHEDTNVTILDGDVGIAVYSQEESLLNDLTVSGGGITIHGTTISGTLTTSNGVTPVIQSGCTISGLITIE